MVSLFTNIPSDLVFKAIERRWLFIKDHCSFGLEQFLFAVDLVLKSTSFKFDDRFYEQTFGTPMGSPLSPILADMVMQDLEVHCIDSLDFALPVFYRYVDEIFTILPSDRTDDVLFVFNNYHPRLHFTLERG